MHIIIIFAYGDLLYSILAFHHSAEAMLLAGCVKSHVYKRKMCEICNVNMRISVKYTSLFTPSYISSRAEFQPTDMRIKKGNKNRIKSS